MVKRCFTEDGLAEHNTEMILSGKLVEFYPDWVGLHDAEVVANERKRIIEAAHDAAIKAQAWDEGCRAAEQFYKVTVLGQGKAIPAPMNPYRSEADHEH